MVNRLTGKRKKVNIDYGLLLVVLVLVIFGLVMIYSTSSYMAQLTKGNKAFYLKKQIGATAVGMVGLGAAMVFNYHKLRKFAVVGMIISAISILLVLSPIGIAANGARRWISLAGVSVQPAEIAKIGVIVFCATMIEKMNKKVIQGIPGFFYLFVCPGVIALMVFKITSNLSSAIIIMGIAVVMWFVASPNSKGFIIALVAIIVLALLMVLAAQKGMLGFRGARIVAWLDPESDSSGVGFQTLQALYAIGSGGAFGKGMGNSMQKLGFVPEAQNDMIFSIICEELGLFGAFALMFLFGLLIWKCMIIACNTKDRYGAMLVVGVMAHLAIQVILNIAVVTNTIPNTGISLPFISYGGTSVVFLLAEIGLVLGIGRRSSMKIAEEKMTETGGQ